MARNRCMGPKHEQQAPQVQRGVGRVVELRFRRRVIQPVGDQESEGAGAYAYDEGAAGDNVVQISARHAVHPVQQTDKRHADEHDKGPLIHRTIQPRALQHALRRAVFVVVL